MWVKKNLIDPTASLNYCLGVSIVQLSLTIGSFFIQGVDETKATSDVCKAEAARLQLLGTSFNVVHILCFLATFYREIFSSKTDLFGQFMRIMEIVCIPLYLACILSAIEHLTIILIRLETLVEDKNKYLCGEYDGSYIQKCKREEYLLFAGRS